MVALDGTGERERGAFIDLKDVYCLLFSEALLYGWVRNLEWFFSQSADWSYTIFIIKYKSTVDMKFQSRWVTTNGGQRSCGDLCCHSSVGDDRQGKTWLFDGYVSIRGWFLGSNDSTSLQETIYKKWVKSCIYIAIYHKHMLTTSI